MVCCPLKLYTCIFSIHMCAYVYACDRAGPAPYLPSSAGTQVPPQTAPCRRARASISSQSHRRPRPRTAPEYLGTNRLPSHPRLGRRLAYRMSNVERSCAAHAGSPHGGGGIQREDRFIPWGLRTSPSRIYTYIRKYPPSVPAKPARKGGAGGSPTAWDQTAHTSPGFP